MKNTQMTNMERLQSVLDGYGADMAHWPQSELELSDFIEKNTHAAQLYREARALDQLLGLSALSPPPATEKIELLQQSILADFADMHKADAAVVVPFEKHKPRVPAAANDNGWMTATALAACFAFGIYLGGTGVGDWSLDLATSLAGLAGEGDQFAEFADAVMPGSFEEDLL